MPRAPRILVEGGLYHVYNRFARGEEVFSDPQEAIEFLELFRDLQQRDGLQVFAWSLLSNHYHLALRTSAVPPLPDHADPAGDLQQGFQSTLETNRSVVAEPVSDAARRQPTVL
jgi:hypothetical protein